jgi:ABC-2 type transport system ATP-binding protein
LVFGGERGLYWSLSGRETLRFWGTMYRLPAAALSPRVEEVLELVGLRDRAHDRVETYSRGMKQRLHLARGLLARPKLLLLDEPTIGLDPVAANEIRQVVRQLQREGTTIFLTTHYMAEAESLCERVAFINEGQIVLLDRPAVLTKAAADVAQIDASLPAAALASVRSAVAALEGAELSQSDAGAAGVTVRLRVAANRVPQLIELLGRSGATRVTMAEPTLEDVYLRLLGDRGLRV